MGKFVIDHQALIDHNDSVNEVEFVKDLTDESVKTSVMVDKLEDVLDLDVVAQ